jgi:Tol biopolymer transport system component/DNA-binding winged helix-turn-helix (wHTH) protein
MTGQNVEQYEFGEFTLNTRERTLSRNGVFVPLPPKVFDTLATLVSRQGSIVTKRELMEAVWPDSFVEESNLSQNIYMLRRVLGNGHGGRDIIENVPRRGYRFNAPGVGQTGAAGESAPAIEAVRPNTTERARLKGVTLLAFVIALVGVGAAAYLFFPRQQPEPERGQTLAPAETVNMRKLTFTGDAAFPVLAPDGESFAFVRDSTIIIQNVASGAESRVAMSGDHSPGILQFSPDGNTIYFRDQPVFDLAGRTFRVSRYGGEPELAVADVWSGVGFSPDGKQMAFIRVQPNQSRSDLIVKNTHDSIEKKLMTLDLPNVFLRNGYPAWSTDGKKIAVVIFKKSADAPTSELVILNSETGVASNVHLPKLRQIEQVAWLYGDNELLISAREQGRFFQLWRFDVAFNTVKKITNDLNIYRGLSVSADGKALLARQFSLYSHLWVAASDDLQNPVQKTFGNLNRDGFRGLDWLPDGNVLYNARVTGDSDIWILRPAGGPALQLTKNAGDSNQNPVASPDGKSIYFNSNRSGGIHIWRMDSGGSAAAQITFGESETELFPQVSSDGKRLFYIRKGPTSSAVVSKYLESGEVEALTHPGLAPDSFLVLSPDGRKLAFHNAVKKASDDETKQIYQIGVIEVERPSSVTFLNIEASRLAVRWSPDGLALDYVENDREESRIWRQPIDGRKPSLIVQYPDSFLHAFAWSRDETNLALSRGKQLNDAILFTDF